MSCGCRPSAECPEHMGVIAGEQPCDENESKYEIWGATNATPSGEWESFLPMRIQVDDRLAPGTVRIDERVFDLDTGEELVEGYLVHRDPGDETEV